MTWSAWVHYAYRAAPLLLLAGLAVALMTRCTW